MHITQKLIQPIFKFHLPKILKENKNNQKTEEKKKGVKQQSKDKVTQGSMIQPIPHHMRLKSE